MKIKYTIIFLIMILSLNGVFANCSINFETDSPFNGKVSCVCNEETKICNCNFTSNIEVNTDTTINPFVNAPNCDNFTVNFYTQGNNLILKNNFKIYFSSQGLSTSNVTSNLIINASSNINIGDDSKIIELPNIIVNSGKELKIKTNDDLQKTDKSYYLKIESILVNQNATLNIDIKSSDGVSGNTPIYEQRRSMVPPYNFYMLDISSNGGNSGDVNLEINSIKNNGSINIDLKTGNGGDGKSATSQEAGFMGGTSSDNGYNGGNSGNIKSNIKKIENYKNLIIKLETGNGGSGGNTAYDRCAGAAIDESLHGGNAGSAGNINIKRIDQINNLYNFYIIAIAGDGGLGGSQRGCCDDGTNGDGGNGGSVFDLNISELLNKKSNGTNSNPEFKVDIKNGALGKIVLGDCTGENSDYFGRPGILGNINIDFLENDSPDKLEMISTFNFTTEEYQWAVTSTNTGGYDGVANSGNMRPLPDLNLKLSEIKINYLKNGSYLPKNISASISIDNDEYFNNDIRINGCYINPTTVNYDIKDDTIIAATNNEAILAVNPNFDLTYRFCPHCEVISLEDDQSRYTKQYNLYSNIDGNINPGDLKIYYSDYNSTNANDEYYTKRTDRQVLPVYTNKNLISGVFNTKINSYEYLIKPEDLNWYSYDPEEDRDNLNSADEYLFCYGEEYILDGNITTEGGSKSFNFPFVPLREQFNN